MAVVMARVAVKAECVGELEGAREKVFAALERECPVGVRYTSYRLADGVTYIALLEIEDGVENPLPAIAEFGEFQAGLKDWVDGSAPVVEQLEVRGSYSG